MWRTTVDRAKRSETWAAGVEARAGRPRQERSPLRGVGARIGRAVRWSLLCGVVAAAVAAPAAAYMESAYCPGRYSAQQCYTGGYHSWIEVETQIAYNRHSVCSKAATAAGNQRTPKSGDPCGYGVSRRVSCFYGSDPNSNAYGYWTGSGDPTLVYVFARTPADRQNCSYP